MADINSNKNAIIIQPITLQIRAPFQLLANQRAIKHYSESRDGLNDCCSFSVVCVAREYTLDCFIQYKGCKSWTGFTSFSPISLPLFQVRRASVLCQLGMPSTAQRYLHRDSSRLIANEEKSTFQISSLLLSSFISNIYTPEKGYYWQNQPNSLKVKGYQEVDSNVKQLLHWEKVLSTSIEPESSKSTSVNVREGNFNDEVRVTWILVRHEQNPEEAKIRIKENTSRRIRRWSSWAESYIFKARKQSLSIGYWDYLFENMYSLPFLPWKPQDGIFFQLNTFSQDTKGKRRFGAFKARIGEKCMFLH